MTGRTTAIPSVLYYLFAYTFMNIGAFAIIAWLQAHGRGDMLDDFNGLAVTSPLAAAAMAVFMFSLTGVPPLIGFYGKYYVILAAIQAHLTWLAVVVVIFSAISAYFYLRVVAAMYFGQPAGRTRAGLGALLRRRRLRDGRGHPAARHLLRPDH